MEGKKPDIRKDPRYLEALRLFDMSDMGWGMPSDPHARENLRHACGLLAAGQERADEFLILVIRRYLGDKYQNAAQKDIERLARSAARAKGDSDAGTTAATGRPAS